MKRGIRDIHFDDGLYGVKELSQYVALNAAKPGTHSRVPYWLRHAMAPGDHRRRRPDYGFLELVSLLVVRDLVAVGLSLRQIRTAEEYLRAGSGHERPFAMEKIYSDGGNVFYEAAPRVKSQITSADLGGQEALRAMLEVDLQGVGYVDGIASTWRPRSHVALDPAVQFGEPCIANTRVQTKQLQALRDRGLEAAELAESFEIPAGAVESALEFEHELALA